MKKEETNKPVSLSLCLSLLFSRHFLKFHGLIRSIRFSSPPHPFTEQEQVQSWALGGSSSRKICCNTVFLRSQDDLVHYAAIVQERKRKYLYVWDQSHASVSDGSKYPLQTSERSLVVAVDRTKKYFLIASYSGKLAKLEPGQDLLHLSGSAAPAGAQILGVKASYRADIPCLSYLYQYKGGQGGLCACKIVNSGKVPSTEVFAINENVGSGLKLTSFQNDEISLLGDDGTVQVVHLRDDGGEHKGAQATPLCTVKNLAGLASVFLNSSQIAFFGLSRDSGAAKLVASIVDIEYDLLLHQYITSEDLSFAKDESLLEATLLDSETVLVATNRKQLCFKFALSEMNLRNVFGTLKQGKEKNVYVELLSEDSTCASITTIPTDVGLKAPRHKQYYEIYEHAAELEMTSHAGYVEENKSFERTFKSSDLRSDKKFLQKLEELLDLSRGAIPLFSESFIARLWDECIRLGCWEGVNLLLSHNLLNDSAHVCQLIDKLLKLSKYEHIDAVLKAPMVFSESEFYDILRAVLSCDTSQEEIQACLMSVVSKGGDLNVETVTNAVKRLNMEEIVLLLKMFNSKFKSETTNDGSGQDKSIKAIVVFISSVVDAHLSALLLSEETHGLIQQLQELTSIQIHHEKQVARLVNYIKDLDSIEPLQEHQSKNSKDFAVEILNINVS